ncbi:MAG: 3-oxoacyl-[acyl-carrier protein] reductase [Myxococcota bacterium]
MGRFSAHNALVTGASRGLGVAIADRLAAEGAHVLVGYRTDADGAAGTVQGITEAGGSAEAVQLDVADAASRSTLPAMLDRIGHLNVLVNNAGITRDGWFLLSDDASTHEVLQTNLMGTLALTRLVAMHMATRRSGAIVNVASVAGLSASPGQSAYAASKGGLLALTRTIAAELAPRGVRVNAVVPGLFDSGMGKRLDLRVRRERLRQIPLGRLGLAEELASAVAFLASDDASYVVGQALVVDGGLVP